MAVTKIIPIRFTIEKSVDYICNPAKPEDCRYVHSEHCLPQPAGLEFQYHLRQARAGGNTIGRHLIQSFAPGEVSPETAHEIGRQLAAEILGGQYAFVMATHVDRGHIHNHFVWCAANVETHKKYRSNKRTYHDIRDASDRLCKENSLSVIIPQGVGKSYAEYKAEREGTSWKAKLRTAIDNVLSESADFDDFLKRMEALGYEIKKGKYISFRAPEQERFTRGKTLGEDYAEDSLKRRISEKSAPKQHANIQPVKPTPSTEKPSILGQLIDIQAKNNQTKGKGFEHWAKIHNLKLSAETLNAVQEYGDYDTFEKKYIQVIHEKSEAGSALNAIDVRIKELTVLKQNIQIYRRTKDVYQQYRSAKNQEKFYQNNDADIIAHRAAKKALSAVPPPVPSVKAIDNEIAKLSASKPELRSRYKRLSDELKQLEPIRKNLYAILRQSAPKTQRHNDLTM